MQRIRSRDSSRRGALLAPLGSLVGALGLACGGPQFDGREFQNEQLAFRVQRVPPDWRAIEVSEALLAFRDDRAQATIAVNGRCGQDGDDVPLGALTHHLFLYFTDRQVQSQETLRLDGREAMRSQVSAALDGVPKLITVYVLKKNGCVYDFMHIADSTDAPRTTDFDRFVSGFTTLRP